MMATFETAWPGMVVQKNSTHPRWDERVSSDAGLLKIHLKGNSHAQDVKNRGCMLSSQKFFFDFFSYILQLLCSRNYVEIMALGTLVTVGS